MIQKPIIFSLITILFLAAFVACLLLIPDPGCVFANSSIQISFFGLSLVFLFLFIICLSWSIHLSRKLKIFLLVMISIFGVLIAFMAWGVKSYTVDCVLGGTPSVNEAICRSQTCMTNADCASFEPCSHFCKTAGTGVCKEAADIAVKCLGAQTINSIDIPGHCEPEEDAVYR